MQSEKLLPCPFCGHEAEIEQFGIEPGYVVMAIEADRLSTQEGGL